jgi:hypothetical protein
MQNKTPSILVKKIVENKDGSASVSFSYNKEFELIVQNNLNLSKKPTKKQVGEFVLNCLENSLKSKNNI